MHVILLKWQCCCLKIKHIAKSRKEKYKTIDLFSTSYTINYDKIAIKTFYKGVHTVFKIVLGLTGHKMTSLEEFVKGLLQCTICNEYMQSHIRLCSSGHSACNPCAEKYLKCVKCKYPFLTTRNKALEELAAEVDVKCDICGIGFKISQILQHRKMCQVCQ